jgi:phosphoribosylglycinamide formyltransferase 2
MLLGSGELGKEVAIELQRLGVEVIAVDRYPHAPAMQVAHRSHVINMLDGDALAAVIAEEQPHLVVPEIEAIATATLVDLERDGLRVIPTARAAQLTMDRDGIRLLAADALGIKTSPFVFAADEQEYAQALEQVGFPCVVKPVMSSSGKGQSLVADAGQAQVAWDYAQRGRLRDYVAHCAACRRRFILRADWPPPGGRRLSGILATPGDVIGCTDGM